MSTRAMVRATSAPIGLAQTNVNANESWTTPEAVSAPGPGPVGASVDCIPPLQEVSDSSASDTTQSESLGGGGADGEAAAKAGPLCSMLVGTIKHTTSQCSPESGAAVVGDKRARIVEVIDNDEEPLPGQHIEGPALGNSVLVAINPEKAVDGPASAVLQPSASPEIGHEMSLGERYEHATSAGDGDSAIDSGCILATAPNIWAGIINSECYPDVFSLTAAVRRYRPTLMGNWTTAQKMGSLNNYYPQRANHNTHLADASDSESSDDKKHPAGEAKRRRFDSLKDKKREKVEVEKGEVRIPRRVARFKNKVFNMLSLSPDDDTEEVQVEGKPETKV
ncbi:hypothetical protein B0H16DRAFT_1474807 [Mycena metata]|uniref:Uncharacterized protein n=1 Tax=Mycena metata TaxID=1033252 RepID=A0AAD7HG34_9AGAR|nr:hypothetical protein B0H16DRAFT_1474807 [Mycena metata]